MAGYAPKLATLQVLPLTPCTKPDRYARLRRASVRSSRSFPRCSKPHRHVQSATAVVYPILYPRVRECSLIAMFAFIDHMRFADTMSEKTKS